LNVITLNVQTCNDEYQDGLSRQVTEYPDNDPGTKRKWRRNPCF
jgi:hypothetical protein